MDLVIQWQNTDYRFDTLDEVRRFILNLRDEENGFEISVNFVNTHIAEWLKLQEITAFHIAELPLLLRGDREEDDVLRLLPKKARELIHKHRNQVAERRAKVLDKWEDQKRNPWLLSISADIAFVLNRLINLYGLEYTEFMSVVNREVLDRLLICKTGRKSKTDDPAKKDATKPTKADIEAVINRYRQTEKINTRPLSDDELTINAFRSNGQSKKFTFTLDENSMLRLVPPSKETRWVRTRNVEAVIAKMEASPRLKEHLKDQFERHWVQHMDPESAEASDSSAESSTDSVPRSMIEHESSPTVQKSLLLVRESLQMTRKSPSPPPAHDAMHETDQHTQRSARLRVNERSAAKASMSNGAHQTLNPPPETPAQRPVTQSCKKRVRSPSVVDSESSIPDRERTESRFSLSSNERSESSLSRRTQTPPTQTPRPTHPAPATSTPRRTSKRQKSSRKERSCKTCQQSLFDEIAGLPPAAGVYLPRQDMQKFMWRMLQAQKSHRICMHHLREASSHMAGLCSSIRHDLLKLRIRYVVSLTSNAALWTVRNTKPTYHWFVSDFQDPRPNAYLGNNAFPTCSDYKLPSQFLTDEQVDKILERIDKTGGLLETWRNDGTIIWPCFDWWKKDKLLEQFIDEIRMYRHHYRFDKDGRYRGWVRNCYHSIAQQAMRVDPLFYLLNVCLRPDHNTRLIPYPYYVKYSKNGDKTKFVHLDLNPDKELVALFKQIQSSVSLTQETEHDCTRVVPGLHLEDRLMKWWNERGRYLHNKAGDLKGGDTVQCEWTREDDKNYAEIREYICKPGDCRISRSCLPHGSAGPATVDRMTMLPWYVPIVDGCLEVEKGGSLADLVFANSQLLPGPSSPSGSPEKYSKPPTEAFLGGIRLNVEGFALPDAIMGRRPWTEPSVQKELARLNGPDSDKYIKEVRRAIRCGVVAAWKQVEEAEREQYGENSYFKWKDENAEVAANGGLRSNDMIWDPDPEMPESVMHDETGSSFDATQLKRLKLTDKDMKFAMSGY